MKPSILVPFFRKTNGAAANARKPFRYAALVAGLALAGNAQGSLILQYEPVVGDITTGLAIVLVNNDQGAIYDSATLTLLSPLAAALYALPANQLAYATIQELVAEWNINIQPPPSGNVYSGWNRTVNADGSVDLTNNGFFWDQWRDNTNYPNQSTMALTVQIPLSQLELDGVPGYHPLNDARIELNSNQNVQNAFVASAGDGLNYWQADGFTYQVVPEPSTLLLVGVGVLAASLGRKYPRAATSATS